MYVSETDSWCSRLGAREAKQPLVTADSPNFKGIKADYTGEC